MVSLIWVSINPSRVFSKKEERLIGRKSFGLVWEGLPAFDIKITLTSSYLVGRWLSARVGKYLVSVVAGPGRAHLGRET